MVRQALAWSSLLIFLGSAARRLAFRRLHLLVSLHEPSLANMIAQTAVDRLALLIQLLFAKYL